MIGVLIKINLKATFFLIGFYADFYLAKENKRNIPNKIDFSNEIEQYFINYNKKMDSLSNQLQNLHISNNSFKGDDLTVEEDFLEKTKKEVEGNIQKAKCDFFCGKRIMCVFIDLEDIPTQENAGKILDVVECSFAAHRCSVT